MAKILVVDDDAQTMDLLRSTLAGAGHECFLVPNGEQALRAVKRTPFDLLVLDVMMPGGISGFEVCRRIRRDSEINALPILVLSAMSGEEEVLHGLAQGADDYVTKPFEMQQLIARMENLIRMTADARQPDELTSLPGRVLVKREVQKRVARRERFALVGTELVRLREFAYHCGLESRQKAIRHLARALQLCGQEFEGKDFFAGHMGGGYFITLIEPEVAELYCRRVTALWDSHLPALYDSMGLGRSYHGTVSGTGPKPIPILKTLHCVTTCRRKEPVSSRELFGILTHLRSNALAFGLDGVQVDRRA